jgi:leucyl-tRNA synthetase
MLERESVVVAVQINGKLRDRVEAPPDAPRERLEALAREQPNVARHLDGHEVVKVVVVPGRLVNFVVR